MKKCIVTILFCFLGVSLWAERNQVLVFRNTGEVNLFFEDELDSIVTSRIDIEGVEQDTVCSQIFYAKDTSMTVSISEIDSVVFGNRNVIEFKSDVHILNENDLSWIIRAEISAVYYKSNTPATILPQVGQTMFYSEFDSIFPCGLAGKVIGVQTLSQEIKISYEQADYADIFERFFYAGEINSSVPVSTALHHAPINFDGLISGKLPIPDLGEISVNGTFSASGNVVLSPLKHYYHADMKFSIPVGFDIRLVSDDSYSGEVEKKLFSIRLPPVACIFHPSIDFYAFAELAAEMSFDYSMTRTFSYSLDWTRKNGNDEIKYPNKPMGNQSNDTAKIDLTINGDLYAGISAGVEFSLVGEIVGVEAKAKMGYDFNGTVNMGMLTGLREYNPQYYGNAQITRQWKAALTGTLIERDLVWGEMHKTEFFRSEFSWGKHEYKLFPEFKHTAAVKHDKVDEISISATTKLEEDLLRPLECGFEILKDSIVQDSIFVDSIQAGESTLQGYRAEWTPQSLSHNDSIRLRPIFRYAGYTIAYADVHVAQTPNILPYIAHMSNGSATLVFGAPIIGYAQSDSTAVHVGNFLPMPHIDDFFVIENPYVGPVVVYADNADIVGTWYGNMDSLATALVFNGDYSGSMTQGSSIFLNYAVNSPQTGNIELNFMDGTKRVFRVTSLNQTTMILWDKKKKEYYTFTKN